MTTSFKGELLNAIHQFGSPTITSRTSLTAPTADTFKAALYVATGTQGAGTATYSATNEVSGTGYTAGGVTVSWSAPSTGATTGFVNPSANIVYTTVTLTTAFDCVTIYNSTQGNKAVSNHTFGSQTITAGTLTLTVPANDSSNALLRLA